MLHRFSALLGLLVVAGGCTPQSTPGGASTTSSSSPPAPASAAPKASVTSSAAPRAVMAVGPGGGVLPVDTWIEEHSPANELFRGVEACAAQERWLYLWPLGRAAPPSQVGRSYHLELPAMSPPEFEKLFKERAQRVNPAAFAAGRDGDAVLSAADAASPVQAMRLSYTMSVSVPAVSPKAAAQRWRQGELAWIELLEAAIGSLPLMVTIRYNSVQSAVLRTVTAQYQGTDGAGERARKWATSHGFAPDSSKGKVAKIKAQAGLDIWKRRSGPAMDMLMRNEQLVSAMVVSPFPAEETELKKTGPGPAPAVCQSHADWKTPFQ